MNLTDGTVVPAIPDGFDSYVITTRSDGSIRMFCWDSSNTIYVVTSSDSSLYFSTNLTDFSRYIEHDYVSIYNLSNNIWVSSGTTNDIAWMYGTLNATSVDIYDSDTKEAVYSAGYGISEESEEENIEEKYFCRFNGYVVKDAEARARIEEINATLENFSGGNKEIYSTDEQSVGTWIDDSTIYKKTFDCGILPSSTSSQISTGLTNVKYIKIEGIAIYNNYSLPLPYNLVTTTGKDIQLGVYSDNITIRTTVDDYNIYNAYVTLYYIKETS